MKRVVRFIIVAGIIASLSSPMIEAREQRQGRGSNSGTRTEQSDRSNSRGKRQGGSTSHGDRPSGNNRPGSRPNGNGVPGNRPVNNDNRPGKRPEGNNRPVNRPHAGSGHRHDHGVPAHHHSARPTPPPPPRHVHWPRYHRPVPPPHYVYSGHGPSFRTILGMVLGTAYNVSLNYLYSNGYTVVGSGDNTIYLNNVSQMNYNWPDVVLHYNNGLLNSSQYIHACGWRDMTRYNSLYNNFCAQYGAPASVNCSGSVMNATWFGYDGRFVTIQYAPGYLANGGSCYYTTLTFGN